VLRVDFSLRALATAGKIAGLIDAVQPDIVHVHQANSVAWHARRALAGRKLPWLLTCWGSDVLLLPQQNRFMKHLVAANLGAASAVTSDSFNMAASAVSWRRLPAWMCAELAWTRCRRHRTSPPSRATCPPPAQTAIPYRQHRAPGPRKPTPAAGWSLTVCQRQETETSKPRLPSSVLPRELHRLCRAGVLAGLYRDARVFVSVPKSDATSISLLEAMGHGCLPCVQPAGQPGVGAGRRQRRHRRGRGRLGRPETQLLRADDYAQLRRGALTAGWWRRPAPAQYAAFCRHFRFAGA
jgi:hypothetical protein